MLPDRVGRILDELRAKHGAFTPTLLHDNEVRGHLTYLIETADGRKLILKVLGDKLSPKTSIEQELANRQTLAELFRKAGIKDCVITEIVESDLQENWSLARYEVFRRLVQIYDADPNEFRRVVASFYETVMLPLLRTFPLDTVVPGDYSMDDIGYRDGTFYLYDLEKNKTLLKVLVDVYGKLIHLYAKRQRTGQADEAFWSKLMAELRTLQREFVDLRAFNDALAERLRSPVLQDVLAGRESELLQRFGIDTYAPTSDG